MTRLKFTTRKIRLIGEPQRETAIAVILHLPIDEKKPLELVVREEVKARGLDINGLYWLRLWEIAEQAWFGGRRYSKEVWHEYAKKNILPEIVVNKDGEERSKWEQSPDGSAVVISTTKLEHRCMCEYVTAVEAFGSGLGVMFSDNPRR